MLAAEAKSLQEHVGNQTVISGVSESVCTNTFSRTMYAMLGPELLQSGSSAHDACTGLGLPDPFDAFGECVIAPAEHRNRAAQSEQSVWEETHIFSPRTCPGRVAKLCTYPRWFLRPAPVAEPYFQLPLCDDWRQLFRFRLCARSLPIEQG